MQEQEGIVFVLQIVETNFFFFFCGKHVNDIFGDNRWGLRVV